MHKYRRLGTERPVILTSFRLAVCLVPSLRYPTTVVRVLRFRQRASASVRWALGKAGSDVPKLNFDGKPESWPRSKGAVPVPRKGSLGSGRRGCLLRQATSSKRKGGQEQACAQRRPSRKENYPSVHCLWQTGAQCCDCWDKVEEDQAKIDEAKAARDKEKADMAKRQPSSKETKTYPTLSKQCF
jgi:hypothetical protein